MNHRSHACERGQTMAEYAVVLGMISTALVLALTLFGGAIANEVQRAADALVSLIP